MADNIIDTIIRLSFDVNNKQLTALNVSLDTVQDNIKKIAALKAKDRNAISGELNSIESLLVREQRLLNLRVQTNDPARINRFNAQLLQTRNNIEAINASTQRLRPIPTAPANGNAPSVRPAAPTANGGGIGFGSLVGGNLVAGGISAIGEGILNVGKNVFETTKQFETFGAVLKNSLGNKGGLEAFELIKDFAKETPFSVTEITESFIKLVNRGFTPTKVELIKLGDIASSQGKSIGQLTEALLDAQTGEFERLKEFGIKGSKNGDQVSLSFKGVTKTVQNTDEAIQKAVLSFGELSGVSGAMAAVARTTEGAFSNLGDSVDQLFANIGSNKGVFPELIGYLSDIVGGLNDWISVPLSQTLLQEKTEINGLVEGIVDLNDNNLLRSSLLSELVSKYPDFLGNIDKETVSNSILIDRLTEVNRLYDQRIQNQLLAEAKNKFVDKQSDALSESTNAIGKVGSVLTALNIDISKVNITNPEEVQKALSNITNAQLAAIEDKLPNDFLNVFRKAANIANNLDPLNLVTKDSKQGNNIRQALNGYLDDIKEGDKTLKQSAAQIASLNSVQANVKSVQDKENILKKEKFKAELVILQKEFEGIEQVLKGTGEAIDLQNRIELLKNNISKIDGQLGIAQVKSNATQKVNNDKGLKEQEAANDKRFKEQQAANERAAKEAQNRANKLVEIEADLKDKIKKVRNEITELGFNGTISQDLTNKSKLDKEAALNELDKQKGKLKKDGTFTSKVKIQFEILEDLTKQKFDIKLVKDIEKFNTDKEKINKEYDKKALEATFVTEQDRINLLEAGLVKENALIDLDTRKKIATLDAGYETELIAITKNLEQGYLTQEEANTALIELNKDFIANQSIIFNEASTKKNEEAKKSNEDSIKLQEEFYTKLIERAQVFSNNKEYDLSIKVNDELQNIAVQYNDGVISFEEYEKQKTEITKREAKERLQIEIDNLVNERNILTAEIASNNALPLDAGNRLPNETVVKKTSQINKISSEIETKQTAQIDVQVNDTKESQTKRTEQLTQIKDSLVSVFSSVGDIISLNLAAVDKQISRQNDRVAKYRDLAEKGNAEQYQRELERLDILQAQKEKLAKRQAVLNTITIVGNTILAASNAVVAITAAAAAGGPAAPFIIAANVLAIVGGIAAVVASVKGITQNKLYKGTKSVEDNRYSDGIDTVPAMLTKGERVVPKDKNKEYWDWYEAIDNGTLLDKVKTMKLMPSPRMVNIPRIDNNATNAVLQKAITNNVSVEVSALKKEIGELKNTMLLVEKAIIEKPTTKFNIDKNGIHSISESINKSNYLRNRL